MLENVTSDGKKTFIFCICGRQQGQKNTPFPHNHPQPSTKPPKISESHLPPLSGCHGFSFSWSFTNILRAAIFLSALVLLIWSIISKILYQRRICSR